MDEELQNTALLERIEKLEGRIRELEDARSIPRNVEKAFQERGFLEVGEFGFPDPEFNYTSNEGFRRQIALSGDAQTIVVPAYPIRFARVKNKNLFVPVYTYAEFGL